MYGAGKSEHCPAGKRRFMQLCNTQPVFTVWWRMKNLRLVPKRVMDFCEQKMEARKHRTAANEYRCKQLKMQRKL